MRSNKFIKVAGGSSKRPKADAGRRPPKLAQDVGDLNGAGIGFRPDDDDDDPLAIM